MVLARFLYPKYENIDGNLGSPMIEGQSVWYIVFLPLGNMLLKVPVGNGSRDINWVISTWVMGLDPLLGIHDWFG